MKLMSKLFSWSSSYFALSLAVGLITLSGASLHAQNQTVSGHLHVTGDTSLSGALNVTGVAELNNNVTNFGANGANATTPGLVLTYTDTVSGTVSTITLATSGTTAIWQWERNSVNGLIPQMTLTGTNSIILWNPTISNSAGITLNPAGDSTFSGSITATGTNSRLPNQQISTDTASVLTVNMADGRYLTQVYASSNFITPSQGDSRYLATSNPNISRLNQDQIYTGINTFNSTIRQTGLNVYNSNHDSLILNFADANGSWKLSSTLDNQDYIDQERICIRNPDSQTQPSLAFYDANNVFLGQYGAYNIDSYVAQYVVPTQNAPGMHMGFDRNLWITGGPTPSNGVGPYYMSFDKEEGIKFYQWVEFQTRIDAVNVHIAEKLFVAGDVTLSGTFIQTSTNSQMPNQQITGMASILTKGLADDLYMPASTTNSPYLTTTVAASTYLTSAQAASAYIPVGYQTSATGSYSTALGNGTSASGYAQLVVGQYNQAQGNASSWSQNDNLFVIGNGTSDSNRSNAVVVKKGGDTSINGNLAVSKNASIGGGFKALGVSTFSGKIVALDTIRIAPKGDLQMGEFTSGEQTVAQVLAENYANLLATGSATMSATQKQNIASFLEAVDSTIGFDNVVECWSFRGGQSIGSGSTAYGMLGRVNASLVNNPTWGSDGLKLNGVDQYGVLVQSGFNFNNCEFLMFAVFQTEDNSYVQSIIGLGEINTANGAGIRVAGAVWADDVRPGYVHPAVRAGGAETRFFTWSYYNDIVAKPIVNNTWCAAALYTKTNRIYFQVNGVANPDHDDSWTQTNVWDVSGQIINWGGQLKLGADYRPYYLKGKIAFAMIVKSPSAIPSENIYSIYKSTIGQGLGLP